MEWFWASRWICSISKCKCIGYCWYPGLLRETTERWQLNMDVPEKCGKRKSFSCPSLFALTCCSCICFLKVGLSVVLLLDLFFPCLSQSMHLSAGNKFWSWFCSNTESLFCMIFTYIVSALSYFPQEAHFKKKDRLISCLCAILVLRANKDVCQCLVSSCCHRA